MRRMIRYAIDNGFDRIAWTTGEQQAERYDLSKQIDSIRVQYEGDKYSLIIEKDGQSVDEINNLSENELEEYVGKELAGKIVNKDGGKDESIEDLEVKKYSGLDLKVGGEGMKSFYDKILPNIANKIGKKYGARVEEDKMETGMEPFEKTQNIHSLPITKELFEAFKDQVPLYKKGQISRATYAGEALSEEAQKKKRDALDAGVANYYSDKLNTPINVVTNRDELPDHVQRAIKDDFRVPGAYDTKNDQVYLISSEIKNDDEAAKTILHEVVAHKGMRELFGEEYGQVLDDVFRSMSPGDISTIKKTYNTEDTRLIADEYIARIAEDGTNQSILDRAVAGIRRLFRKVFRLNYTQKDIRNMLARSERKLKGKVKNQPWGVHFNQEGYVSKEYSNDKAKFDRYLQKARDNVGERSVKWINYALTNNNFNGDLSLPFLEEKMDRYRDEPRLANRIRRAVEFMEENPVPQSRYPYRVLLAGHYDSGGKLQFVQWDKPMSNEQINMVHGRMKEENIENGSLEMLLYDVVPASRIYRALTNHFGSDRQASEFLDRAGIDGMGMEDDYMLFSDGYKNDPGVRFRIVEGEITEESAGPYNIIQERSFMAMRKIWQDRMISIREWQHRIVSKGGQMNEFSNPYRQENLSHGIVQEKMRRYHKGYIEPMLDVISEVQKRTGMSWEDVNLYMKAKHAPERNEKFIKRNPDSKRTNYSGFESDKAREITDGFEKKMDRDLIDKFWKRVRKATGFTLDAYKQYGVISPDEYNKFTGEDAYEYYVPLRGWKNTAEDELFEYMQADVGRQISPFRSAKGRTSEAEDPLQYIENMAHTAIVFGEKNRVKQHAASLVRNNKDVKDDSGKRMHYFKKVYWVWTGDVDKNGKKIYEEKIEKPSQELFDQGYVKTRFNSDHMKRRSTRQAQEHEVDVWISGEKYTMVLPADVANALNKTPAGLEGVYRTIQQTWGVKKIPQFTRFLATVFTSKNPAFIPVNQIRDLQYAYWAHAIKGGKGDQRKFIGALKGCRAAIIRDLKEKPGKTKYDKLYQDFKISGGETGWIHMRDVDQMGKDLKQALKRMNASGTEASIRNFLFKTGRLLDHWATRSENLSRFATYVVALENGKSPKQAAQEAKNITVNFNRKGRASNLMGSLYLFFNASLQGGHNIIKIGKDNPGKFAAVGAGFVALGFVSALINHMWAGDDDDDTVNDWEELNDYHKYNNLVVPLPGKDRFVTVPLPHGFRWFNSLGVLAYQTAINKEKDLGRATKEGLETMFTAISPFNPIEILSDEGEVTMRPLVPSVMIPWYDIKRNEDFAGSQIAREPFTQKLKGRMAESQLGMKNVNKAIKWTTDFLFKLGGGDPEIASKFYIDKDGDLKKVVNVLDINPSKVEHIFEYYLGGTGRFVNNVYKTAEGVITGAYETASGDREFQEILSDVNVNNLPVVRRLYAQPWQNSVYTKYYDILNEFEDYRWHIGRKAGVSDETEVDDLMDPYHEFVDDELRYLRKDLRYIDEDIDYMRKNSATSQLDDLYNQRELLVRNFVDIITQYREDNDIE